MANFSGGNGEDLMAIATCSLVFVEFKHFYCKPFDLLVPFKHSIGQPAASAFIHALHDTRLAMVKELQSNNEYDLKLRAVDDYLSHCKKFLDLAASNEIRIDSLLSFDWKGAVTLAEGPSKYGEIAYDLAMTLHAKAIIHYLIGKKLSKHTITLAPAGQNFITAACIMEYLRDSLLPSWKASSDKSYYLRPPEVNEQVCTYLCSLFKLAAQQVSIAKAVFKEGGTGSNVMVKLCSGCLDEARACVRHYQAVTPEIRAKVDSSVLSSVGLLREIMESLCYYYQGKSFQEKNETGKAVGCFRKAKALIQEQKSSKYNVTLPGLPRLNNKIELTSAAVRGYEASITAAESYSHMENSHVYFQEVPSDDSLPQIPTGILLLKTSPLVIPPPMGDYENLSFVYESPYSKGVIGAIFSLFGFKNSGIESPSSSIPSDSLAPSAPINSDTSNETIDVIRSDSDLARDLQKRFNNGLDG